MLWGRKIVVMFSVVLEVGYEKNNVCKVWYDHNIFSSLSVEIRCITLNPQYTLYWCNVSTYGLVQDCSNSSALAMELRQSFTKPLI